MTNKEVIQLFAKHKPELLVTVFDDFYIMGWNDGAGDRDTDAVGIRNQNWLNQPHEPNVIFLQKDVDELTKMNDHYGEWVKYPVDVAEHPYHCSKCGWSRFAIDRYVRRFNFCPGCGTEMIGEQTC